MYLIAVFSNESSNIEVIYQLERICILVVAKINPVNLAEYIYV